MTQSKTKRSKRHTSSNPHESFKGSAVESMAPPVNNESTIKGVSATFLGSNYVSGTCYDGFREKLYCVGPRKLPQTARSELNHGPAGKQLPHTEEPYCVALLRRFHRLLLFVVVYHGSYTGHLQVLSCHSIVMF